MPPDRRTHGPSGWPADERPESASGWHAQRIGPRSGRAAPPPRQIVAIVAGFGFALAGPPLGFYLAKVASLPERVCGEPEGCGWPALLRRAWPHALAPGLAALALVLGGALALVVRAAFVARGRRTRAACEWAAWTPAGAEGPAEGAEGPAEGVEGPAEGAEGPAEGVEATAEWGQAGGAAEGATGRAVDATESILVRASDAAEGAPARPDGAFESAVMPRAGAAPGDARAARDGTAQSAAAAPGAGATNYLLNQQEAFHYVDSIRDRAERALVEAALAHAISFLLVDERYACEFAANPMNLLTYVRAVHAFAGNRHALDRGGRRGADDRPACLPPSSAQAPS